MKLIKDKSTKNTSVVKPRKNLSLAAISAFIIIILAAGIFFGLSQVLATESYYVLLNDIPPKTQVNSSMLKEVITAKGTAPQNAITLAEVNQGSVYSKYPLKAGDILTPSNTGITLDSSSGIPEDWVITSFNISADDAVGGNIARGDYFDIIGVSEEKGSQYLFHNVLALALNYNQPSNEVTADGKVIPIGETLQYVIGMPAESAAMLHHTLEKYEKIKLVLSPVSLKYKTRDVSNLTGVFLHDTTTEPVDLFEGTDSSFKPVLRDDNGRPVTIKNCELGLVSPMTLCDQLPKDEIQENTATPNTTNEENTIEQTETDNTQENTESTVPSEKE